ncbi:flagellin [Thermomonas fusca]|uniref:flagellin N-terminal helical domain-containing protein n=1 Tax=Thermomonas fusca TaxID=215690 RepID=UPI0004099E5E|nr:flagellin [Thermomonas fusca]
MSIINTNVMSLNSQRNLTTNNASLGTTIQRLSSGLRINSAKDDAAGLAISERFTTQIRGLNQAARNANDGISLAQTAEGALGEIGNNLQRIRELAVQSRNATNSTSDRQALDAEVQQLKAEIQRVSEQTSFNDTKLLDGSFTAQAFQIGANQGQVISIDSVADAGTASLGSWSSSTAAGAAVAGALTAGELTINNVAVGAAARDAKAQAAAINAISSQTGVTATASSTTGSLGVFATSAGGTYSLSVGGVNISQNEAAGYTAANLDTDLDAVKDTLNAAGITFTGTAAGSNLTFSRADGANIDVVEAWGAGATAGGFAGQANDPTAGNSATNTYYGTMTLTSFNEGSFTIAGGTDAGLTNGVAAVTTNNGFQNENVLTTAGADKMIVAMDAALKSVNSSRADLGAIQNRFSSVISNLNTTSENLTASRSRIRDTDFAKETAELARTQILAQAGTAMLAQANQSTQNVLSLLR